MIRVGRSRPSRFGANAVESALIGLQDFLPAHALDEELQAIALLVLVVAKLREDAHDGVGDVIDPVGRNEVVQEEPRAAEDRRAASVA